MSTLEEMEAKFNELFDEAQQLQLEAMIALEVGAILNNGAGLDPNTRIVDVCAALGMTMDKVWEQARERVLARISWHA